MPFGGPMIVSNGFNMTFTALREAATDAVTGVQMMAQRGSEKWTSRLLSPGEFAELMLAIESFRPLWQINYMFASAHKDKSQKRT
jgi:hypothetical protein